MERMKQRQKKIWYGLLYAKRERFRLTGITRQSAKRLPASLSNIDFKPKCKKRRKKRTDSQISGLLFMWIMCEYFGKTMAEMRPKSSLYDFFFSLLIWHESAEICQPFGYLWHFFSPSFAFAFLCDGFHILLGQAVIRIWTRDRRRLTSLDSKWIFSDLLNIQ